MANCCERSGIMDNWLLAAAWAVALGLALLQAGTVGLAG